LNLNPLGFTFWLENGFGNDAEYEHAAHTPTLMPNALAPRSWHLMTLHWDMNLHGYGEASHLLVDRGLTTPEQSEWYYPDPPAAIPIDFTQADAAGAAAFFLGRRGNSPWASVADFAHYGAADATFDELAIYDFTASGDPWKKAQKLAEFRFEEGRFYKESAYAGLQASPGLNKAGRYFSAPIDLGPVSLKRLAWTQIVPRGLKSPAPAGGKPEEGDPGPDGAILFEFSDIPGTGYLQDVSAQPIDLPLTIAAGHPVGRRVSGPFRLHAVFQPNLSDPLNTALVDPLVLDDISLVYQAGEGSPILAWREE
jgi:hypothetical protein